MPRDKDADAAFVWLGARPTAQVIDGELWPKELQGHVGLLSIPRSGLSGSKSSSPPSTCLRSYSTLIPNEALPQTASPSE
jgi:hypothetical protein